MTEEGSGKYAPIELAAIRLFAKQDWKELENLLRRHEPNLSTTMLIVKASMLRVQGKYPDILLFIDDELKKREETGDHNPHLFLHKAFAHGEIGRLEDEEEMFKALEQALNTEPECLLARATLGLRLAERLPFRGANDAEERQSILLPISA